MVQITKKDHLGYQLTKSYLTYSPADFLTYSIIYNKIE